MTLLAGDGSCSSSALADVGIMAAWIETGKKPFQRNFARFLSLVNAS